MNPWRCPLDGMERYWTRRNDLAFGAVSVLMVMFWVGRLVHNTRAAWPAKNPNYNPNAFVAWSTNSSVYYVFTYDPHAADVWRFETGGQALANTNDPTWIKPKWVWKN